MKLVWRIRHIRRFWFCPRCGRSFWFCPRCGRSFFVIGRIRDHHAPDCTHPATGLAGLEPARMVRIRQS